MKFICHAYIDPTIAYSFDRGWDSVISCTKVFYIKFPPFLGAAAGSPYIVFITRFRRMASGHGYIYIERERYIYNVDAAVV